MTDRHNSKNTARLYVCMNIRRKEGEGEEGGKSAGKYQQSSH